VEHTHLLTGHVKALALGASSRPLASRLPVAVVAAAVIAVAHNIRRRYRSLVRRARSL